MTFNLIGSFAAIGLCALFHAATLNTQQCAAATLTAEFVAACDCSLSPAANAPRSQDESR